MIGLHKGFEMKGGKSKGVMNLKVKGGKDSINEITPLLSLPSNVFYSLKLLSYPKNFGHCSFMKLIYL